MASATAARAVKAFRLNEFKALQKHITRFGPLPAPADHSQPSALRLPNPFLPILNETTGKWNPPRYSLRQQADLVRKAKASGLLYLLPPGPKAHPPDLFVPPAAPSETASSDASGSATTEEQQNEDEDFWKTPVEWVGKTEFKTNPGEQLGNKLYASKKRMFKGHKWERVKEVREKKQKVLMRDMEKRVKRFKEYHQRRKPNPLKPPRSSKAPKLPY